MGRVRGYLGISLDGYIAGPHDEIAWLEEPRASGLPLSTGTWANAPAAGLEFAEFMAGVGCLVMGRRTYDVVAGFGDAWPYGDTPLLVLTSRPLSPVRESVMPVAGDITAAVAQARAIAGEQDVYVDGGTTLRSALSADLVDHLILTILPTALGAGIALFAGLEEPTEFAVERVAKWGDGFVQVHLTRRA